MALTLPWANSRQEEATDRACQSPTLLRNINIKRNAIFCVRNFSDTESRASKGARDNPSSTTAKSQAGNLTRTAGLKVPQVIKWCSLIQVPRDVICSLGDQLAMRPQKVMVRQSAKRTTDPPDDLCARLSMGCLDRQELDSLRSGRKYFKAKNTAIFSRQLMCQER